MRKMMIPFLAMVFSLMAFAQDTQNKDAKSQDAKPEETKTQAAKTPQTNKKIPVLEREAERKKKGLIVG